MSLRTWERAKTASDRLASRLALSIYVGLAAYCVLSVLVGPAGLTAYRSLEQRKAAMEANVLDLGSIRESLNGELESLRSDPDRAAREARSLGYLRKGETAIVLGERTERVPALDHGKVLPYGQLAGMEDSSLKAIALGVGLAFLAFVSAPRKAGMRKRYSLQR
jgi:cell division protein FtsB